LFNVIAASADGLHSGTPQLSVEEILTYLQFDQILD
jgi:hypothetical protein